MLWAVVYCIFGNNKQSRLCVVKCNCRTWMFQSIKENRLVRAREECAMWSLVRAPSVPGSACLARLPSFDQHFNCCRLAYLFFFLHYGLCWFFCYLSTLFDDSCLKHPLKNCLFMCGCYVASKCTRPWLCNLLLILEDHSV